MKKEDLRASAAQIREIYLKKPYPKGNVAIAEIHLTGDIAFGVGATSRGWSLNPRKRKSPVPIPLPQSKGGQFEPIEDVYSGRRMDTDAEYKVLSFIAETLVASYDLQVEGQLYLYTERSPCTSCQNVIRQFKRKFPNVELSLFWDHPYP